MPQDPFAPLFDDKVDPADPFADILAKPSPMRGGPSGVAARDARAAGYQQGYGDKIVEAARSQIGKTKYVWGGCKPGQTDCSGFTQSVAKSQGFDLVRTAQEQFKTTKKVDKPEKGDLVFMKTPSRKHKPGTEITHVGIYDGEGNLIHNSSSKGGVVSVPLASMQKYIRGYGRIGSIEQFESELKPEKKVVVKSGPIKTIDDFLSRMPEAQLATDQAFSKQYAKTQETRKAQLLQSYSNPKSEAEFKSALTTLKKEFQLDLPAAVPEGVQDLYKGNPARAFEGNGADMFARGFGKALLGAGSPETLSALRKAVGKDYDKVMSGAGQNLMLAIASGISPVNAPQSLATMAAGVLPTAAMSNYLVDQGPEDVVAGAIFGPLLGKMLTKLGAGPAGKLLKEVASASPEKAYAKLEQLDLIDESVFKAAQDIEQLGATFRKPTARVTDDGGKKPVAQPYGPGTDLTRQENPFDILFKEDVSYPQGETPKLVEMGKPVPKTPKVEAKKVDTATTPKVASPTMETVVKETPKKPETVKEPWQMTAAEWQAKNLKRITPLDTDHPMVQRLKMLAGQSAMLKGMTPDDIAKIGGWALDVEDAIKSGKPVPEDTLRDYIQVTGNDKYGYPPKGKRGVWFEDQRYAEVSADAAKGKPVPAEVLADYPDLAAKYPPVNDPPATTVEPPKVGTRNAGDSQLGGRHQQAFEEMQSALSEMGGDNFTMQGPVRATASSQSKYASAFGKYRFYTHLMSGTSAEDAWSMAKSEVLEANKAHNSRYPKHTQNQVFVETGLDELRNEYQRVARKGAYAQNPSNPEAGADLANVGGERGSGTGVNNDGGVGGVSDRGANPTREPDTRASDDLRAGRSPEVGAGLHSSVEYAASRVKAKQKVVGSVIPEGAKVSFGDGVLTVSEGKGSVNHRFSVSPDGQVYYLGSKKWVKTASMRAAAEVPAKPPAWANDLLSATSKGELAESAVEGWRPVAMMKGEEWVSQVDANQFAKKARTRFGESNVRVVPNPSNPLYRRVEVRLGDTNVAGAGNKSVSMPSSNVAAPKPTIPVPKYNPADMAPKRFPDQIGNVNEKVIPDSSPVKEPLTTETGPISIQEPSRNAGDSQLGEPRAELPIKRDFQAEKEAIRAEIRKKRSVAGSGIDPTIIGDYLKLAKVYVEEGIDSIANLVKSLKDDGASDNEADLMARVAMGEPLTKVDKRNLAKFGLLRGIATTRPVTHPGLNSASLVDKIQRLNSMTTDAVKRSGGLDANEMTQAHILMNDLIRRIPKMSEDEAKSAIEQLVGLSTAVERSGSSRGFLLQQLQQRARQRGNKRLYEDFIQRVSKQDLTKEQRGAVEAIVGDIQKSSDKLNKATVDAALSNKELDRAVKEAGFTRYSDAEVAAAKKRLLQALYQPLAGIFSMGAGGGYVDFGAVARDLKIVLSPVFGKVTSFGDLFNEARSYIPEDKMSDVELTDALIHIVASERRIARMSNAWGDDYLQVGSDMIKDSYIPEWKKSVEDLFTEAEKLFDVDEDAGLSLYELFAKKVADAEKLPEGKERRLALGKIKRWLDTGKIWEEDLAMKGFLGSDGGFFSGKGSGLADNVVKQARKELDDAIKASDLFLISQLDSTWGEKIARWTENNRTIDPLNRVVDFLSGSWNVLDVPARVLARIPDAVMSKLGFTPSMASLPKTDILRIVGDMRRLRVRAEIKGGGALREGAKEVYKSPLFKKWDKFMGEYVALPDAAWRAMVRPYAELEAAIVLAKREVADGVLDQGAIKARAEQIMAENSREYTDSVAWIMDEANFSQDSLFSKMKQGALRTVKKSLPEALEPPVTTFVNLFFGFTRVFSNIARLNLEYTGGALMPAVYIAQIGAKLGVDIFGNKKSLNAALKAIPDRDVRRLSIAIGRGVYGAYVFSAIGDMLYDNGGLAPKTFDPGRGIIDYGFWDQMPGPFKVIVERNRQRFLEDRLKDKTITKAQYEKLLGPPDEDALKQIEALDKKRKMGEITMQQYIDEIKGIEITPQAGLGAPPGSTLSWSSMTRVALSQPIFTNMAKIDPNSADAFADYIAQQSMSLLPMSGGSGVQRIKDQGVPFVWDGEGVYSREGDGVGRVARRIPGLADNYLPKGNPYALNGVKGSDPVVKELMYLNAMPRIVLKGQDKGYRTTESKESARKRLKPILAREFSQIKRRMAMPDWKTKTPLQKKNIIQSIRDRNRQRIEKIFKETGVRLDMLVSDGE